jgi:hypothetical protein
MATTNGHHASAGAEFITFEIFLHRMATTHPPVLNPFITPLAVDNMMASARLWSADFVDKSERANPRFPMLGGFNRIVSVVTI